MKDFVMEIRRLSTRAQKKGFLSFRSALYQGDAGYVCTDKFVLTDVLFARTEFARDCRVLPLQVREGEKVLAQAMLLQHPALPYLQLSFFDALPDSAGAVQLLVQCARRAAHDWGARGIVAGLNGHLSYGVGILSDGFEKISFDSLYNKSYYREYFAGYPKDTLSTYRAPLLQAIGNFPQWDVAKIKVRTSNFRTFRAEMERMRALCEKTIAKTHLYFPTKPLHFYQLLKDLKPFLRPENLLFAEDGQGRDVGFLFWHPDFNCLLDAGREYSIAAIAARRLLYAKRMDTVKVNALGTLSNAATFALIDAFRRYVEGKYTFVETNFIWDNNIRSSLLMKKILGAPHRKYEVYYLQ